MNREEFIKEQNSPENIKARNKTIMIMNKLISSQTELRKIFNAEKKERIQEKTLETKLRLIDNPRKNKQYG